jgi:hypothetical protein
LAQIFFKELFSCFTKWKKVNNFTSITARILKVKKKIFYIVKEK